MLLTACTRGFMDREVQIYKKRWHRGRSRVTEAFGPLLVEIIRGAGVESRHEVDLAVVDDQGRVVSSWGDSARPVLPRSAVKPIQALPLVSTGAAESYSLSEVELALACSSHSGERSHVLAVEAWLDLLDLGSDVLACGVHEPLDKASARALSEAGVEPTAVHNNCSGKHAGFLTVVQHLGLSPKGYLAPGHPLQADHVTPALAEAFGVDFSSQVPAVDGCGIPAWTMPLDRLAAGWAQLGLTTGADPGARLLAAMRAQPHYVAGTGRACTQLIAAATGRTVVKNGAEGVFCAVLPDDGLGVALKVRDGAYRAAETALSWVLALLGRFDGEVNEVVKNWTGTPVGEVRVADGEAYGLST